MTNLLSSFRCGFIAIVGKPNVGKSTLMNHLIGQKISITSKKAQTTRHKVNGIRTEDHYQMIFVDTPGFQLRHRNTLNDRLNQNVLDTLNQVDMILFVVEAGRFNDDDKNILKHIPKNINTILVINKADKLKSKEQMQSFIDQVNQQHHFMASLAISAKHNLGISTLLDNIQQALPEGVPLYPEDMLTDKPSRFLASEIVREKIFRYLGQELPYAINVECEYFQESDTLYKIYVNALVDKENQKGILIGQGGERLKKISTEARMDMEKLFGIKVFLKVQVKCKSGWADDVRFLRDLGM